MTKLSSLGPSARVVVVGATGGIGHALTASLVDSGAQVIACSRGGEDVAGARGVALDLTKEETIRAASEALDGPPGAVIVATGVLHDGDDLQPEKDWRALAAEPLLRAYHINAVGPALVAKHFMPTFERGERGLFAVLSARVGSISDNRVGGWYGYRAAKAGLNQILKTLAIEAERRQPGVIVAGLQPGTVRTPLSDPFRSGPTEREAMDPAEAAGHLLEVIDGLGPDDSGQLFDYRGERFAP